MPSTIITEEQPQIRPPEEAYNLAAGSYDDWRWQAFWHETETPLFDEFFENHHFPRRSALLDAGCGTGFYLDRYHLLFARSFGFDSSHGMIEIASSKVPAAAILSGSLADTPFGDAHFDMIVCARVLSHLPEYGASIRELSRVLSPGGLLLLSNVDARHPYKATRIPTGEGDVYAEAFKHRRSAITTLAADCGLALLQTALIGPLGQIARGREEFMSDDGDVTAWAAALTKVFPSRRS